MKLAAVAVTSADATMTANIWRPTGAMSAESGSVLSWQRLTAVDKAAGDWSYALRACYFPDAQRDAQATKLLK